MMTTATNVKDALLASGCTPRNIQPDSVTAGFTVKQEGGTVIVTHWIPSSWLFKVPYNQRHITVHMSLDEYRLALNKAGFTVKDCQDHLRVQ